MNDPTNWNTDEFNEGLATFKSADMAHLVAKRCNAYPGLVEIVKVAIEVADLHPQHAKHAARWREALRSLGEQIEPVDD